MTATVHEWCGQVDDPERGQPCPCPHGDVEAQERARTARARHTASVLLARRWDGIRAQGRERAS